MNWGQLKAILEAKGATDDMEIMWKGWNETLMIDVEEVKVEYNDEEDDPLIILS